MRPSLFVVLAVAVVAVAHVAVGRHMMAAEIGRIAPSGCENCVITPEKKSEDRFPKPQKESSEAAAKAAFEKEGGATDLCAASMESSSGKINQPLAKLLPGATYNHKHSICNAQICPHVEGMCCADNAHCCPKGFKCGETECVPEKLCHKPLQPCKQKDAAGQCSKESSEESSEESSKSSGKESSEESSEEASGAEESGEESGESAEESGSEDAEESGEESGESAEESTSEDAEESAEESTSEDAEESGEESSSS